MEHQQGTPEETANRHVVDMVKFDLSGIPSELFYGPHVLFEKPFNSPTGMRGFKTGELGLGHIGLLADDVHEAARVLENGLGFKVSDNMPSSLPGWGDRFFHCNPREHTAVVHPHKNLGPKRVAHFMVEVNDINDVGSACSVVRSVTSSSPVGYRGTPTTT